MIEPTLTELLAGANLQARRRHAELLQNWTYLSLTFGKRDMELQLAVQDIGQIDVLVRCLEDEYAQHVVGQGKGDPNLLSFGLKTLLSSLWVIRAYEAVRARRQRYKDVDGVAHPKLALLSHRLGLVRMPLAKGEIAFTNRERAPVNLAAMGDGTVASVPYDPQRDQYFARRMYDPNTGSDVWGVLDIRNQVRVEISRRDLADEFLDVLPPFKPPAPAAPLPR